MLRSPILRQNLAALGAGLSLSAGVLLAGGAAAGGDPGDLSPRTPATVTDRKSVV